MYESNTACYWGIVIDGRSPEARLTCFRPSVIFFLIYSWPPPAEYAGEDNDFFVIVVDERRRGPWS